MLGWHFQHILARVTVMHKAEIKEWHPQFAAGCDEHYTTRCRQSTIKMVVTDEFTLVFRPKYIHTTYNQNRIPVCEC